MKTTSESHIEPTHSEKWPKNFLRNCLAVLGAMALWAWALSVFLGTGIGYDRPTVSLLDGDFLATLWQLAKAVFLGALAWGVSRTIYDMNDD